MVLPLILMLWDQLQELDVSVQIHSSDSPSAYPRLWCRQGQPSTEFCVVQPNRLQFQDIATAVVSAAHIYLNSVAISSSMALPRDSGVVLCGNPILLFLMKEKKINQSKLNTSVNTKSCGCLVH